MANPVKRLRVNGLLLTASLTDRILTYLLLPFGEPGQTNLGRITAGRGSATIPDDPSTVHLNVEHDPTHVVGKATTITETDQGIVASFKVSRTTAGDDLLVEADDRIRACASVELDNPVIRAGRLISSLLTGAGAVTDPAFPSAQLIAADAGEMETTNMDPIEQAVGELEDATTQLADATTPADVDDAVVAVEDALAVVTGDPPLDIPPALAVRATTAKVKARRALAGRSSAPVGAVAPTGAAAGKGKPAAAPQGLRASTRGARHAGVSGHTLFARMAEEYAKGGERRMLAALADVVPGDILGIEQPQFVGELWSGKAYVRRYVPLFNHANLTSFEVTGWQWVTKPVVAAYGGDKGEVPTAPIETEATSEDATRIAGAHDIDRKFKDFSNAGFWEAYYKAMTESYALISDGTTLTAALTAAGGAIPVGDVPDSVSLGMTCIVDGALAVLAASNSLPSFAVAAPDLYREILLTRNDDTLTYLNAALGLEDGTVESFKLLPGGVTAGHVLVGAGDAMTVHELGEVPIRVEAENITLGGVDAGVFGYMAHNVHDAAALVLVDSAGESS